MRIASFVGCFFVVTLAAVAMAEAPRVVSTTPRSGDVGVDPALAELVVEFDRDMQVGSHSWVGGGPGFPATTGPATWRSPRICVLPVALEAGRTYSLGLNGGRFINFKAHDGTLLVPRPLVFRTAGGDAWRVLTPEDNRAALVVLRRAIDERYSYRDRLGLDWDAVFAEFAGRFEATTNGLAFALVLRDMLAATEDPHIAVEVGGTRLDVWSAAPAANFNGRVLGRLVPGLERRSSSVFVGRFDDGIGYVLITTWSRDEATALAAADVALSEFHDAPAIIIDVRPNGGGDEQLAARVAGRFIATSRVYAMHDTRTPAGLTEPSLRRLQPTEGELRYGGPVCVLMGGVNMSSCEAFLLMMRQVDDCTLVGARSFGSSGNPRSRALHNGVTVILPSWRAMDADGVPFEGVGLAPDVEVDADAAAFRISDPVLERALEILRQQIAATPAPRTRPDQPGRPRAEPPPR